MYYIAWLALVIAFAVMEGITAGLVSIWFCFGAIGGLVACAMGASIQLQIAIFAIISLVCMVLVRPFAKKYFIKTNEKTNADRILDADAIVTETVHNINATGQIKVYGEHWTARSDNNTIIPEGTLVRVLRIEGVKAIIQPK